MAVAAFNETFLQACWRKPTEYTPVWFMRQAGRYLPEYQKLREKYDVLTICRTPELAAEVCLQPVRRLGVDAAILFADIMLVPLAMGVEVKIVDSVGPVIEAPVSTAAEVETLHTFGEEEIDFLLQEVRMLRQELTVPLIGFSGAPFTLASYLVEGKPTREWYETKSLMYQQPEVWGKLMETLTEAIIGYLQAQVNAGVQAVQLFDSWVGCLSPGDYRRYVLPYNQRIMAGLAEAQVPRIMFGTDTGAMLRDFADVECEVVGVDWRIDIGEARRLVGENRAIQGNLDPVVLRCGSEGMKRRVDEIFDSVGEQTGFIFNLGHGVLPQTSPELLKELVGYVHAK